MKMNPIFNLLRRTMFAALAATTIACGGDDPVVPQLPGGGNNGQDGTEEEKPEIKPDEGITLYGLVSDSEGNPLEGHRRQRRLQRRRHRCERRLPDRAQRQRQVRLHLRPVGL